MSQRPLFVIKDCQGEPRIGFLDSDKNLWFVNPLNLYKSLFHNVTKDDFVDQVIMLDAEGHLCSDMNVYLGQDGSSSYWLYYDCKCIVWPDEDDYEDGWRLFDNYQANVLEVLNEYYKAVKEFGIDKLWFSEDAIGIISDQFKFTRLISSDPWQLGYANSRDQHEYYCDCLIHEEYFDMSIDKDVMTWSFKKEGKCERRIKTSYIPLKPLDLMVISRALEDFCLTGDASIKIQSNGSRDIQATTIYLHNVKNKDLSKFGAMTEVIVVPEDYRYKSPVLYGFGYTYQVIKKLYDTFLSNYIWAGKGYAQLETYNAFKSSIVESFLTGSDVLKARPLNKVKYICCIAPDIYEHWRDENGISCIAEDDTFEIADDPGGYHVIYKAIAPTFEAWHKEYEDATDFAETSTNENFNYADWHRRGYALARAVRNQLPDDVDVWYMYAFEDMSHHSEKFQILKSSKEHLLAESIQTLVEEDVKNKDKWIEILKSFIAQCPNDHIFDEYTEVRFLDGDLDILWFTPQLDCRASLNLEEFTFHVWAGDNHGQKTDKCRFHAVGGEGIYQEDGSYDFAQWFYDHMCHAMNLHNDAL